MAVALNRFRIERICEALGASAVRVWASSDSSVRVTLRETGVSPFEVMISATIETWLTGRPVWAVAENAAPSVSNKTVKNLSIGNTCI